MYQHRLAPTAAPDQLVWKVLFDRQTALLHRRAAPAFCAGLAELGLHRAAVPDIGALSAAVHRSAGWRLEPVGQPVSPAWVLDLLADRRFPVTTRLRPMQAFDFSPTPDLFHDLFGHVPMLLDPAFADFLQALGQAARGADPALRQQLWALYFFTAEFGLVAHDGRALLYGAGLLSSAGEIHHCVNENTPRPGFELSTVLRTPVRETRFQTQYFVLPSWAQLGESVAELAGLLSGDWAVAA